MAGRRVKRVQIHRIPSLDLPELTPYRTLRQNEEHRAAGIFVAEGDKVVARLLQSHFGVVSVLLPEKRLAEFEPLIRARAEDVPIYVVEIAELEKLTGFPFFQGVLAVGKVPRTESIESVLQLAPSPRLFVAIDGLTNSENVGLIIRSAAAFGAHALIVDRTSASPFLRRSVRNSMGAIFKLPICEVAHLTDALTPLRRAGVRIIAAHPHTDRRTIADANFRADCCIILGSEGTGIASEVLAECDEAVAIPMSNEVESLNVGSAAAVFLYEVARQRTPSR
jgi:tRNA G18 (ribose-2'-O)-methylase SpoU